MTEQVPSDEQCWCVGDLDRVTCDLFEDNDRGECLHCGHREECHDNQ